MHKRKKRHCAIHPALAGVNQANKSQQIKTFKLILVNIYVIGIYMHSVFKEYSGAHMNTQTGLSCCNHSSCLNWPFKDPFLLSNSSEINETL